MAEDIRAFLSKFTEEDLVARGVLRPSTDYGYLLRARSVEPLVELMREYDVSRLEASERDWFLTSEFEFHNRNSGEEITGDARSLRNPGNVFNLQNKHVNPYFGKLRAEDITDVEPLDLPEISEGSPEIKFGLERDLQRALRGDIRQLESSLRVIDGGTERVVDAGRIDITAEDADGNLVVIELKAGPAPNDSMTQLLAYMGTIQHEEGKSVRGILVANDFPQRVVYAAQAVPNVTLKQYSFQFAFNDR